MRADILPVRAITVPPNMLAIRSHRGTVVAYLRALSLTAWFGSLVLNYWWRKDWEAITELAQTGFSYKEYYYYGFAIFWAAHLTLGLRAWISAPFDTLSTWPSTLFTIFCAAMLVLSPLSLAPRTSCIYACGTWVAFLLCNMYWRSDYNVVRNVLVFTGVCLFAWLVILLIHHGLPRGFGGAIGSINRNTTSTVALAAMACCMFAKNKAIRRGAVAGAMALSVVVNSRGTILATCVFIAAYYVLHKGTAKALWHAFLGMFLMIAVLAASAFLQQSVLEGVLRLHDPVRGFGAGLSGRIEKWQNGVRLFWERPLIGHGFRASTDIGVEFGGIHGGYLKIFVETGIIGGFLIISAVCIDLLRRVKLAQQFRDVRTSQVPGIDAAETMQLNTIAVSVMCAILTLWLYEPLYINLGSCISVLFFLMLAAPSYVSAPIVKRG